MSVEKTLVNIYLPALERSVTGDILSMIRFMPEGDAPLNIIAADIYSLTFDFARDFCQTLTLPESKEEKNIQNKFKQILLDEKGYDREKYNKKRVFNVVIEGEDAINRISDLMGDIRQRNGTTILGKYGFFNKTETDLLIEFPASAPSNKQESCAQLELMWGKYKSCGGPLKETIVYPENEKAQVEQSLVIAKPNVFDMPHDPRLGNVVNAFSKTGMSIISAKIITPTPEAMKEFYLPHKNKPFYGELVDFMSNKCSLALLYEGVNVIQEIRKAALCIVRRAYIENIIENTVHTSENKEDFEREYKVINFENNPLPK
ncbi:MAG: nucleoside-diphosphate kinase [Nitrospirota bacterium]